MDLGSIAHDLYSVPPDEFIETRRQSVAAARAAGDLALSRAIGDLRKPNTAAAVVNLLARESEDLLQEVVDLGDELREAQEQGDGPRLRALNEERKTLLRRVAAESVELARAYDMAHGPAVVRGVDETIKAALANPDAARVVQAGLLVTTLSGAGFGYADLAESVALPDFELKPRESRPRERRLTAVPDLPDPRTARVDAARELVAEATEQAGHAAEGLEESRAVRDANETLRSGLHQRIDALKDELRDLQAQASEADANSRGLDRAVAHATTAVESAEKERARARERLNRLMP